MCLPTAGNDFVISFHGQKQFYFELVYVFRSYFAVTEQLWCLKLHVSLQRHNVSECDSLNADLFQIYSGYFMQKKLSRLTTVWHSYCKTDGDAIFMPLSVCPLFTWITGTWSFPDQSWPFQLMALWLLQLYMCNNDFFFMCTATGAVSSRVVDEHFERSLGVEYSRLVNSPSNSSLSSMDSKSTDATVTTSGCCSLLQVDFYFINIAIFNGQRSNIWWKKVGENISFFVYHSYVCCVCHSVINK